MRRFYVIKSEERCPTASRKTTFYLRVDVSLLELKCLFLLDLINCMRGRNLKQSQRDIMIPPQLSFELQDW